MKSQMVPARVVEIVTPKKFLLNGLWLGPRKPKRAIAWVHGLGSSMFSKLKIAGALVDTKTAVLIFNNRGHGIINRLRSEGRKKSIRAGAAHERFADSIDDIQGAINVARKNGARNIYVAGHSTGCQKSIYWAHKKKAKGAKGIILLAPVSDWAAETMLRGRYKIEKVRRVSKSMATRGKGNELLPSAVWHEVLDAQRFLSLYSPDSVEEIFSYALPKKSPRVLRSVHIPILVLWAAREEFTDMPAKKIKGWFEQHNPGGKFIVVPRVKHSFKGGEKIVAREIRRFMER